MPLNMCYSDRRGLSFCLSNTAASDTQRIFTGATPSTAGTSKINISLVHGKGVLTAKRGISLKAMGGDGMPLNLDTACKRAKGGISTKAIRSIVNIAFVCRWL